LRSRADYSNGDYFQTSETKRIFPFNRSSCCYCAITNPLTFWNPLGRRLPRLPRSPR
jgi:hypothetical protein